MWKLFKRGMILTTIIGWIMSGGILVFGGNFLALWMGPAFALKAALPLQILSVWTAFMATSIMPFYFLNATENERLNTLLGASSSCFFVLVAIFAIPSLGVAGAAWARLLSYSPALVAFAIIWRRCLNERRWYVGVLLLLPTAAPVLETVLFDNGRMASSVGEFLAKIGVFGMACAICAAACWLVYERILQVKLGSLKQDPHITAISQGVIP